MRLAGESACATIFSTRCRDCRAESALISVNQIQTGLPTLAFLCVSFGCLPLSAQVPPGTGASGPFNDQNFKIVTETLSRHQSMSNRAPAWIVKKRAVWPPEFAGTQWIAPEPDQSNKDRKSTRLNSSHRCISYAGFCLT